MPGGPGDQSQGLRDNLRSLVNYRLSEGRLSKVPELASIAGAITQTSRSDLKPHAEVAAIYKVLVATVTSLDAESSIQIGSLGTTHTGEMVKQSLAALLFGPAFGQTAGDFPSAPKRKGAAIKALGVQCTIDAWGRRGGPQDELLGLLADRLLRLANRASPTGEENATRPPTTAKMRTRLLLERDEAISEIRRQLVTADSTVAVVNVWGMGGVGKSSLLEQLAFGATDYSLAGASSEVDRTPLQVMRAWRQSLNSGSAVFDDFDGLTLEYDAIAAALPLPPLGTTSDEGRTDAGSGAVQRAALRSITGDSATALDLLDRATAAFLASLEGLAKPTVLAIDTYEDATGATDLWLRRSLLASDLTSVATKLLIVNKDQPLDSYPHWQTDLRSSIWSIELAPLSDDASAQVLRTRGVPDESVPRLVKIAGGLPWALELLSELPADDDTEITPRGRLTLDEVHQLVVDRLVGHLAENDADQLALVFAAACMESFDSDLLHRVAKVPRTKLARFRQFSFVRRLSNQKLSLHEAMRIHADGVLRTQFPESRRRYLDRYRKDQEKRLLRSSALSDAYFDALRGLFVATWKSDPSELGAITRFLPVGLTAPVAEHLLPLIEQAIVEQPSAFRDARLLFLKAQVHYILGNLDQAQKAVDRLLRGRARGTALDARLLGIEIKHRLGQVDEALRDSLAGLADPELHTSPTAAAIFHVRAAEMLGIRGQLEESLGHGQQVAAALADLPPSPLRSNLGLLLSYVSIFRGDYGEGREALTIAATGLDPTDQAYLAAHVDSAQAWLHSLDGDLEGALHHTNESLRQFVRSKDNYGAGLSALSRGEVYRRSGIYDRALAWNRYAVRAFNTSVSPLYEAIAEYQVGVTLLEAGRPEDAKNWLSQALDRQAIIGERHTTGTILLALAGATGGDEGLRDRAVDELMQGGYYSQALGKVAKECSQPDVWTVPDGLGQELRTRGYFDVLSYAHQELFARRLVDAKLSEVADVVRLGRGALRAAYDFHPCMSIAVERRLAKLLQQRALTEPVLVDTCRGQLQDACVALFSTPLPSYRLFRLAVAQRALSPDEYLFLSLRTAT